MKIWKSKLVPALWALGGVLFLVPAVVGPVIKGEPLNNVFLVFAFVFFTFAVVFFVVGRKSGGGSS